MNLLRMLLCFGSIALSVLPASAEGNGDRTIRFSAPPVAQAVPLLRAAESTILRDAGTTATFTPWRSPEQLRAFVTTGSVDAAIAALPTAAVLSNRGIPCKIAAVYSAPLWIVSTEEPDAATRTKPLPSRFAQLDAQEVLLPFGPGNMPELALDVLASELGVNPKMRHCGSAMEAVNLLRRGQAMYALLPEPAATKAATLSEALSDTQHPRTFHKLFTLKDVWAQTFPEKASMPTAALLMVGPMSEDSEACFLARQSFIEGVAWTENNPDAALRLAQEKYPELARGLDSLSGCGKEMFAALGSLGGQEGEDAARFFWERIFAVNPAAIGGRLPDQTIWGLRDAAR